ncbi:MAG: hypothetical protein ACOYLC_15315, partial [Armatimonadaceae bacterium]
MVRTTSGALSELLITALLVLTRCLRTQVRRCACAVPGEVASRCGWGRVAAGGVNDGVTFLERTADSVAGRRM